MGVKKTRYAVTCRLIADFAAVTAGMLIAFLFFH
jgi:spore maturation protein SpmB